MADTGDRPQDSAESKSDAIALAELAEAEAVEAEALAAAARARARAIKLRREAQAEADKEAEAAAADADEADESADETSETPEATETVETAEAPTPTETAEPEPGRRRLRAPTLAVALTIAAVVAICALLGVSGWMAWHHHSVVQERQRAAAYIATARQGVINLTSLDFNKAKEGVQRVLDSATGEFKDDFQRRAQDFESVVKDSKAVTEGSVAATAVESMNNDSAVVLVLANERVTNIAGAKDQPRTFRFRVSVVHDGDQLKLSKVEFVL
ncbi:MAG: Mce-associated rane protein [Mycobacterium sp.]|nr:Mce-associated rane protein [Mycobacterium sp.]